MLTMNFENTMIGEDLLYLCLIYICTCITETLCEQNHVCAQTNKQNHNTKPSNFAKVNWLNRDYI